ncbi:hypothetical protein [Dyella silvae]|uniref:hypothetical protein n=1 Tax=Dyella silvae TaxID=2994424 RepID=UPI002264F45C|nr:hypothetical protein [Dyella silvae]
MGRAAFFQTGELRLTVLEGHVGAVTLNNSSRVNDDRLARLATEALCPDGVGDACPLTAKHLERAQLLLQDEPGVSVAPTALSPEGVAVGQTSVNLTTTSSIPLVSGYAGIDNYGIPASGMNRLGAGVVLTDLLHAGATGNNQILVPVWSLA